MRSQTSSLPLLVLLLALPLGSRASVISKGTLQSCDSAQDGLKNCGKKLLVTYAIAVGQNATDTIAASIGEIKNGETGAKGTLGNKQISITFSKTSIYFYYPTFYSKTVNSQPWEQMGFGTGTGSDFTAYNANPINGVINICDDADSSNNPICGWVKDGVGDNMVASQGKCCACALQETVFKQMNDKRSGLECQLTSKKTQSAHCLRMDPLWYHIYDVGAMSYWYAVQVTVKSCPNTKGKAAADKDCSSKTLELTPSNTVVFDGKTAATSSVQATLLGDLGSFQTAPNFQSKYLAIPAGTAASDCQGQDDPTRDSLKTRCLKRIKAGIKRWMLIDKNLFGEECNKIGVNYQSFRFESEFCDQSFDSCTKHQLADYYDYDQDQETQKKTGKYWLSSMSHLGLSDFDVEDGKGAHRMQTSDKSSTRLMFKSNRFQNTLISLQIKAEDISLTTNVANGKITNYQIRSFEVGSNDGAITIKIKNTDTRNVYAQFILSIIDCDKGIVPATEAGQAIRSLTGQEEATLSFNVISDAAIGSDHTNAHICTAQLLNAKGEFLDKQEMTFKTWDTKVIKPMKGCDESGDCGNTATGKASGMGGGSGPCECSTFDFKCYFHGLPDMGVFKRCSTQITTIIVTVVVAIVCLVILGICCKVLGPKRTCQLLCLPFKCFAQCCKCSMDVCEFCFSSGDNDRSSRRKHKRRKRKEKKKKRKKKKKKKKGSHQRQSDSSCSESDEWSSDEGLPRRRQSDEMSPMSKLSIPLAVFAVEGEAERDEEEDRDEVYRYAGQFDNMDTSVFFNISGDGNEKSSLFSMEGHDFSIRGILSARDGEFIFQVSPNDRYQTKMMCDGELQELNPPEILSEQISEVTLTPLEVYWHISTEMRCVAINV